MSMKQRERALRRAAARPRGNMPPIGSGGGEGYDEIVITRKGRALVRAVMGKIERGVPVEQLSEQERVLLALAAVELDDAMAAPPSRERRAG